MLLLLVLLFVGVAVSDVVVVVVVVWFIGQKDERRVSEGLTVDQKEGRKKIKKEVAN